jgi:hypothetical protein
LENLNISLDYCEELRNQDLIQILDDIFQGINKTNHLSISVQNCRAIDSASIIQIFQRYFEKYLESITIYHSGACFDLKKKESIEEFCKIGKEIREKALFEIDCIRSISKMYKLHKNQDLIQED